MLRGLPGASTCSLELHATSHNDMRAIQSQICSLIPVSGCALLHCSHQQCKVTSPQLVCNSDPSSLLVESSSVQSKQAGDGCMSRTCALGARTQYRFHALHARIQSHALPPLDVCLFKSLSEAYSDDLMAFLGKNKKGYQRSKRETCLPNFVSPGSARSRGKILRSFNTTRYMNP
jgi:hypothetical protein